MAKRNTKKVKVEFIADVSNIDPNLIGVYLGEELDNTDIRIVNGKFTWTPLPG